MKKLVKQNKPERLSFADRVIKLALSIPTGRVTTYGRIAKAAGGGNMASRSVTAILGKAQDRGIKNIPFHRIVYADGKFWTSTQYHKKRLDLYKKEKIEVENGKIKNFSKVVFEFK
jgi:alkylated DNA nucleotide flippase Atl1